MNVLIAAACFLAAFVLSAALGWLELIPWDRSEGRRWTDRARILWPIRKTQSVLVIYLPLLLAAGCSLAWPADLPDHILRWFAAFTGATAAGWWFIRRLYPSLRLTPWLQETIAGYLLRFGMWGVLVAFAIRMPGGFGLRTWLTLAGAAAFLMLWFTFSVHLLRLFALLKPPGERLTKIVTFCTQAGGPRVRALWQARMVAANAFAMPLTGTLIFSDSLLENLTDEEVAAVCSHELGHLAESNGVVFCRYVGAMAILPLLLLKPAYQWAFPGAFALLLLYIVWVRLSHKLAHRMELHADASASHQQPSEGIYARALEKIYRYNQVPAVMPGKNISHPHLYDRMLAAGVRPEFPEPLTPEKFTALGWILIFAGPMILILIHTSHHS